MKDQILQFAFIVAVPIVLAGGALVTLFLAGALLEALERPGELRERIEGAFRRPPSAPHAPSDKHYYKPYWQAR
jgi:hypothetical protein